MITMRSEWEQRSLWCDVGVKLVGVRSHHMSDHNLSEIVAGQLQNWCDRRIVIRASPYLNQSELYNDNNYGLKQKKQNYRDEFNA